MGNAREIARDTVNLFIAATFHNKVVSNNVYVIYRTINIISQRNTVKILFPFFNGNREL